MKIYLIRHGQTTGDIEGRYGGTYDDHLTDEGKRQANLLIAKLKDKGIQSIYSSPYLRAKETAEILSNGLHLPLEIIENIRERNHYGFMSGQLIEEMKQKYPQEAEAVKDYHSTIRGAEDYESFKQRILAGFEDLTGRGKNTVAIVTHGGPVRCFFREVLKTGEMDPGDCQVFEIDKNGGYNLIGSLN